MTEPDEATRWSKKLPVARSVQNALAHGYRAGQAASAERIKALEGENAALQELAGTYQVRMSNMLTRLEERYPEDFVWLKEADQ
jgi:DNA-binding transcriptional MocR family regulator